MKKKISKLLTVTLAVLLLVLPASLVSNASGPITVEGVSAQELYDQYFSEFASIENNVITITSDAQLNDVWVDGIAEDIVLDLNGYVLSGAYIDITGSNERSFTIKDSVGTGKISGNAWYIPLNITDINLKIEGGTYVGVENCEDDMYDSFAAISLSGQAKAEIISGKFYGADGKDYYSAAVGEVYYGSSAIEIYGSEVELYLGEDVELYGGDSVKDGTAGAGIAVYGEEAGVEIVIDGAKINGGNGETGGNAIYSEHAITLKIKNGASLSAGNYNGQALFLADGSMTEISADSKVTNTDDEKDKENNKPLDADKEDSSNKPNNTTNTEIKSPVTGTDISFMTVVLLLTIIAGFAVACKIAFSN